MWLAVIIGVVATVGGIALTPTLVGVFDTGAEVADHAETYLGIAFLGTTPLLVMLAATGVLRGLQDTRTPLLVAVVGNGLNIVFNVVLVYGLDLGIAGSAIGSVLAQVISALWFLVVVVRAAREHDAPLSPDRAGISAAAHAAVALVVRTLALRACLLVGTYAVTRVGTGATDVNVATHQIAITLWSLPRLRPRRDRDRGPGPHRPGAGQRRRRRHPSPHLAGWCSGAGAAASSPGSPSPRWPRSSARSSPPIRRCATCSCRCCSSPRSANRSPGWCSCSTGC